MPIRTERILLGHCAVDSGQILLVDPCYANKGFDYDEVCRAHSVGCDHSQDLEDGKHRHVNGELIHDFGGTYHHGYGGPVSSGVVTSTGFGDGYYPVYAMVEDHGSWGKRVASVTIQFIEEDE